MAGHRDYNKSKKEKLGRAGSGDPRPGPSLHENPDHLKFTPNQVIQRRTWTCYVKKYRAKHSATLVKSISCNKQLPHAQKS